MPVAFAYYMTPNAMDLLACRIVLALAVTLVAVSLIRGAWRRVTMKLTNRRDHLLLMQTGHLIALNCGLYIYAVATYRVLDVSLGYCINPIILIVLIVVI